MAKLLKPEIVEATASRFRSANGLSESQPIDFVRLLPKIGVLTLFRPLSDDFSGMCLKNISGDRFMLINSNNVISRQNFTMAHELFHLFEEDEFEPHVCNPGLIKTPSEKNADGFAASLLMPVAGLLDFISNKEPVSISVVLKMEHYYSVSRTALLYRLKNIGAINEREREQLDTYSRAGTAQRYGYEVSLYHPGKEGTVIGDYMETARRLFEEEKISEGHYVELLSKIGKDGICGSQED